MKVLFTIDYKLNGKWTALTSFYRDLFDEGELDETLDSGVVNTVPTAYIDLPPFTPIRITATNADTGAVLDKDYKFVYSPTNEGQTFFGQVV